MARPRMYSDETKAAALNTIRQHRKAGASPTVAIHRASKQHGISERSLTRYWYGNPEGKRPASIRVSQGRKI